jgi:hypothetical protein
MTGSETRDVARPASPAQAKADCSRPTSNTTEPTALLKGKTNPGMS